MVMNAGLAKYLKDAPNKESLLRRSIEILTPVLRHRIERDETLCTAVSVVRVLENLAEAMNEQNYGSDPDSDIREFNRLAETGERRPDGLDRILAPLYEEVSSVFGAEKLDAGTGLHGAELPIRFSNAKRTLGRFNAENGCSFQFSNYYYQDPEWPIEEALDVIRHEYAHYMDYELYGNLSHGISWKHCCNMIGALPIRCYNKKRAQYHQQKHTEEAALSARYDGYAVGSRIEHPRYGVCVIEEVTGGSVTRCVTVDFTGVDRKKLDLTWVDKNCRKHT